MANKVKFGLKNCYYAPATIAENGTITYGTPVRLPGAVSLSMDAEGENENFYADDSVYYVVANNAGYSGDLELALIPDSFKQDCLGEILDSQGLATEKSTAQVSPFALLFEFSGDAKKVRHAMYNCTASRPSVEGNTVEDSKTPQTETITIAAAPVPATDIVKSRTTDTTSNEVYSNWFQAVQVPVISETTSTSDSFTGDGTTTAFTLTHTPASVTSVTVGGTAETGYTVSGAVITFTTAPADEAAIVVTYTYSVNG